MKRLQQFYERHHGAIDLAILAGAGAGMALLMQWLWGRWG